MVVVEHRHPAFAQPAEREPAGVAGALVDVGVDVHEREPEALPAFEDGERLGEEALVDVDAIGDAQGSRLGAQPPRPAGAGVVVAGAAEGVVLAAGRDAGEGVQQQYPAPNPVAGGEGSQREARRPPVGTTLDVIAAHVAGRPPGAEQRLQPQAGHADADSGVPQRREHIRIPGGQREVVVTPAAQLPQRQRQRPGVPPAQTGPAPGPQVAGQRHEVVAAAQRCGAPELLAGGGRVVGRVEHALRNGSLGHPAKIGGARRIGAEPAESQTAIGAGGQTGAQSGSLHHSQRQPAAGGTRRNG